MAERRAILATVALALFAAGMALGGSAITGVADAPPHRNLMAEWTLLWVGVALVIIAVYVFLAALSERLPLPGMQKVRQEATQHAMAVLILSTAYQDLSEEVQRLDDPTDEEWQPLVERMARITDFVRDTWGNREGALLRGSLLEIVAKGDTTAPNAPRWHLHVVFAPFLARLEAFLGKCEGQPLPKEHKRVNPLEWLDILPKDVTHLAVKVAGEQGLTTDNYASLLSDSSGDSATSSSPD